MIKRFFPFRTPAYAGLLGGLAILGAGGGAALVAPAASARPPAAGAFCQTYADAKICHAGFTECATCHTQAPARNSFGAQISERILPGEARPLTESAFLAALPSALKAVEDLDADGDGASNLSEILAGTQMANADSAPRTLACTSTQASRAQGSRWNVCGYDPEHAFRKVNLDFCGRSPTRAQLDSFRKLRGDDAAWRSALGKTLDECLTSRYWIGKDGVVWNLANTKIRPAHTIKSGQNPGPVPLGDYDYDFNLFSYANSGDRDVRDMLLAQYFVTRVSDDPVKLEVATEDVARRGQQVPKERRVGLITTRWNAALNTMFTAVPRTTAAQAYRAYLGYDIAKMEGLDPTHREPEDFDAKGVKDPECAACHSTLDPLTYPFSRYNGFFAFNYAAERMNGFTRTDGPRVNQTPEHGILLGKPVKDLLEWGQVAANSDPFAKKVVYDYWKLLIGRDPDVQASDATEYTQLWRGLKSKDAYDYRVEKMLHALVLTNAYGRP